MTSKARALSGLGNNARVYESALARVRRLGGWEVVWSETGMGRLQQLVCDFKRPSAKLELLHEAPFRAGGVVVEAESLSVPGFPHQVLLSWVSLRG